MKGKVYLVPTPIGNYQDITLRALEVLKVSDFIICEEYKPARRLLAFFKIEKELISLNEHNEKEESEGIISRIMKGENTSLISDCGTPLFSDPGHFLVNQCFLNDITVIPLPGASSLLPALISSGFDIEKFYYYGWLSPKKDLRRSELLELKKRDDLIILLDTPYRLKTLLEDVAKIFGSSIKIALAYQLTLENEHIYRGRASEILAIAEKENLKGEFVLIINNRKTY